MDRVRFLYHWNPARDLVDLFRILARTSPSPGRHLRPSRGEWTARTKASHRRIFCKIGGAGLRSAVDSRIPAYLGNFALTAPSVQQAFNIFLQDDAPLSVLSTLVLMCWSRVPNKLL